jgi:hypothetical protein
MYSISCYKERLNFENTLYLQLQDKITKTGKLQY